MTIGELLETRDEDNSGMKRCNSFCDYTNEDLFKAVKEKNSVKIRCLINNGVDVKSKDEDGWTALMYAVDDKDKAISRLLIELGADVNIRNDEGQPALMNAIFINAIEIAKILIKNGADFNILDNAGQTPLMIAALSNVKEIGELLILEGADINVKDESGRDAIYIANKSWGSKKYDYFLNTKPTNNEINIKRTVYYLNNYYKIREFGNFIYLTDFMSSYKQKYGYKIEMPEIEEALRIINETYSDRVLKLIDYEKILMYPNSIEIKKFFSSQLNTNRHMKVCEIQKLFYEKYNWHLEKNDLTDSINRFNDDDKNPFCIEINGSFFQIQEYEIQSVKTVPGASLNSQWSNPMQVITTDRGVYIDNVPNSQFGFFNDANPGYDWSKLIGQTISNVKIYRSRGYNWINYRYVK